jgi:hypothetical protein
VQRRWVAAVRWEQVVRTVRPVLVVVAAVDTEHVLAGSANWLGVDSPSRWSLVDAAWTSNEPAAASRDNGSRD